MATVDMDKVNKVYENGFHAVKDLSLDVGEGEFMVLVGPSGCGKTIVQTVRSGLAPSIRPVSSISFGMPRK